MSKTKETIDLQNEETTWLVVVPIVNRTIAIHWRVVNFLFKKNLLIKREGIHSFKPSVHKNKYKHKKED